MEFETNGAWPRLGQGSLRVSTLGFGQAPELQDKPGAGGIGMLDVQIAAVPATDTTAQRQADTGAIIAAVGIASKRLEDQRLGLDAAGVVFVVDDRRIVSGPVGIDADTDYGRHIRSAIANAVVDEVLE